MAQASNSLRDQLGIVVVDVVDSDGAPMANAVVYVTDQITNSPVSLYASQDGGPTSAGTQSDRARNKAIADSGGRVQFWATRGRSIVVRSIGPGGEVLFEEYDIQPGVFQDRADAPGGSDVTIINNLTTGGAGAALSAEMGKTLNLTKQANLTGVSDVPGLVTALSGKQATLTGVNDVPGLSAALNAKQATLTGVSDVPGLTAALAAKQATLTGISDVPGLVTALSGKQATLTGISDVPGLVSSLNAKTQVSSSLPLGLASAASAGSSANASRDDHRHAFPTQSELNVVGLPLSWNANTNTPTLTSSTPPAGGVTTYVVTVAGTTTLNGISSWSVDDILYFDISLNQWKKIAATVAGGVATYSATTSSAAITGNTTETAALATFALGAMTPGKVIKFRGYFSGGNADSRTDIRIKLNGTTVCVGDFHNFYNGCAFDGWILIKSTSLQRTMIQVYGGTSNVLNSVAAPAVDVSASCSLTLTAQNTDSARSVTFEALVVEVA